MDKNLNTPVTPAAKPTPETQSRGRILLNWIIVTAVMVLVIGTGAILA
jgi:hypothetical protein